MFLHTLIRWLDFVVLVTLLGGLSFRYFVWLPSIRARVVDNRPTGGLISTMTLLVALAFTSLADLSFRALMMSGQPASKLFSVLPTVLMKTHFGSVWIWKFGLILFLGVVQLIGERGIFGSVSLRYLSLGCAMALGLTTGLSGHAADQGSWSWTVLGDWIHVLAISGWVGGLFAFQLHLRPSLASYPEGERRDLLADAIRRFSTVAMTAVGAMLLTGIYNMWVHVHSLPLLTGTDYGEILILKLSFVVPMVLLGGMNRYYGLPILENRDDRGLSGVLARAARAVIEKIWTRPRNMGRLCFQMLLIEALLGLAVLGCTAAITQLAPPHQVPVEFKHDHHMM
jgi:putative copper resistance protein D